MTFETAASVTISTLSANLDLDGFRDRSLYSQISCNTPALPSADTGETYDLAVSIHSKKSGLRLH